MRPTNPCRHCGGTSFYTKQKYRGYCEHHLDIHETIECDNGDMWENSSFRYVSKYFWCSKCHKRGEKINE